MEPKKVSVTYPHKRYKLVTKDYALKPLTNLCEKKLFTLNAGTKYQRGCLKGETAAFTFTGMAEKHLRGPDCKQARKIENPDNLPEEHFWGTIFENTFCNSIVFRIREKKKRFCLINCAKIRLKIKQIEVKTFLKKLKTLKAFDHIIIRVSICSKNRALLYYRLIL